MITEVVPFQSMFPTEYFFTCCAGVPSWVKLPVFDLTTSQRKHLPTICAFEGLLFRKHHQEVITTPCLCTKTFPTLRATKGFDVRIKVGLSMYLQLKHFPQKLQMKGFFAAPVAALLSELWAIFKESPFCTLSPILPGFGSVFEGWPSCFSGSDAGEIWGLR